MRRQTNPSQSPQQLRNLRVSPNPLVHPALQTHGFPHARKMRRQANVRLFPRRVLTYRTVL